MSWCWMHLYLFTCMQFSSAPMTLCPSIFRAIIQFNPNQTTLQDIQNAYKTCGPLSPFFLPILH